MEEISEGELAKAVQALQQISIISLLEWNTRLAR